MYGQYCGLGGIMKKMLLVLMICILTAAMTYAEPIQEVENNQSYFTANLQKQPKKDNKQKIHNHFSFFVINVQINGKVDRLSDNNGQ